MSVSLVKHFWHYIESVDFSNFVTSLWPYLQYVNVKAVVELQNCLCVLFIVMCIADIPMLHDSMSSCNRPVDMIVSIFLSLTPSFKCFQLFVFMAMYIFKTFLLLSAYFCLLFKVNFHEIDPLYVNRPFCPSVL